MFEAQLFSFLTSEEALSALIGDRLFPNVIPVNEERPAVAYQLLDADGVETHQGAGELFWTAFQFSIQDDTYEGAIAVEAALISALNSWNGVAGDYQIIRCNLESKMDGYNLSEEVSTRRVRYEIEYLERT